MRRITWIGAVLFGLSWIAVSGVAMAAELTPYAYVQLTKKAMDYRVQNLNALIYRISQFSGNGKGWYREEATINAETNQRFDSLYSRFGVTEREYLLFYSANRGDVENYLDAYPKTRDGIEKLAQQQSALLDKYEQMKVNLLNLGPVVPE